MALLTIYKWERKHYYKNTERGRWLHEGDDEVLYITPDWMRCKTGEDERRFWRAIGSRVRITRDYDGTVHFNNVRPDGFAKCAETFTPIDLWCAYKDGGWRERQALEEAYDQRVFELVENTGEHVCIRFGTDTTAVYDLVDGRWVG